MSKVPTRADMTSALDKFAAGYRFPIVGVLHDYSDPYNADYRRYNCYAAISDEGELLLVRGITEYGDRDRFWRIKPEELTAADAVVKPPVADCDIHLAFPAYGTDFDFLLELHNAMDVYGFGSQPENIKGFVEFIRKIK